MTSRFPKEKIDELIGRGALNEALDALIQYAKESNRRSELNDALLLQSKLNDVERKYSLQSTLSHQEYDQIRNKIVVGVQQIQERLEKKETATFSSKRPIRRIAIGLIIIFTLLIGGLLTKYMIESSHNEPPPVDGNGMDSVFVDTYKTVEEKENDPATEAAPTQKSESVLFEIEFYFDDMNATILIDKKKEPSSGNIRKIMMTEGMHDISIVRSNQPRCDFKIMVRSGVEKIYTSDYCH